MSKFKLTQTAAEVQDILNNSLQKPTGLTKTKLVGVGVNGQENIEIGDNLTLANGKLSAATGGGVNGLQSDAEGNLTANKNLGVEGKLTLKSLVSATNPDGDITKELGGGGGARHCYFVDVDGQFIYIVYTEKNYNFTIGEQNTVQDFISNPKYAELHAGGESNRLYYPAIGTYTGSDGATRIVRSMSLYDNNKGSVIGKSLNSSITTGAVSINLNNIPTFFTIVQLY